MAAATGLMTAVTAAARKAGRAKKLLTTSRAAAETAPQWMTVASWTATALAADRRGVGTARANTATWMTKTTRKKMNMAAADDGRQMRARATGGGEGEGEGEGEEGGGRGSPALHVPQSSGSQSPNEAEEGNSPAQGPESRLRSDPAGSSPAADGGSLPTAAEIIRARAARWEPGSGGGGGQRPQTKPREAPGGGGGGRGGGGGGGDHRGSGGGGEQTVQTVSRHR